MGLRKNLVVLIGKIIAKILRITGHHAGTLPGRIMLKLDKNILAKLAKNKLVLAITGTNGKTTTAMFISKSLADLGYKVASNSTGANLLSGIITTFTLADKETDVFVIEIDEAVWGNYSHQLKPNTILVTNIFRDQLDRYGEMNSVYELIAKGIKNSQPHNVILCADDPLVTNLKNISNGQIIYFGINNEASIIKDSIDKDTIDKDMANKFLYPLEKYNTPSDFKSDLNTISCPNCQNKLSYKLQTVGHLGDYYCDKCSFKRPQTEFKFVCLGREEIRVFYGSLADLISKKNHKYYETSVYSPLKGLYNAYNVCAAVATTYTFVSGENKIITDFLGIAKSITSTKPAFGRQEKVILKNDIELEFMLVKNPVGFNQNLHLLTENSDEWKNSKILFLLNSNLADGKDVSWIWDVPFEDFKLPTTNIYVGGERGEELALRLKYANYHIVNQDYAQDPDKIFNTILAASTSKDKILIIANYTALLNIRQKLAAKHKFNRQWNSEVKQ